MQKYIYMYLHYSFELSNILYMVSFKFGIKLV